MDLKICQWKIWKYHSFDLLNLSQLGGRFALVTDLMHIVVQKYIIQYCGANASEFIEEIFPCF